MIVAHPVRLAHPKLGQVKVLGVSSVAAQFADEAQISTENRTNDLNVLRGAGTFAHLNRDIAVPFL